MAVIANLNTRQDPVASGLTGTQVIKFIDAPRVYIKTADTVATPITVKSNGATPSGYTDLGIVDGKLKITYSVDVKEVRTGIDETLRVTYGGKKTASFEFNLSQFDDVAFSNISGLTASSITSGSVYQFSIGSSDLIQKALLLVSQNKLDGKEWQFYHPNAYLSFAIGDNGQETILTGTANCPSFTYGSGTALVVGSIFA